jgi:hypothetical protein
MIVPELDPVVTLALRGAAALLFLSAAWHKLRAPEAFREALAAYGLLPASAVPTVALVLVGAEVALGLRCALALSAAPLASSAPLAGAALIALYAAAIAAALASGRRAIDCGCAGPGGRRPLSGALVARNLALSVTLVLAALPPAARSLVWLDEVTALGLLLVLSILYGALDVAIANAARMRAPGGPEWSTL